jgi:hypothetical protein
LLGGVEAEDRFADFGVDVLDRLGHTLAEIALRIAVAQFDRLLRTRRCARRHRGAAGHAGFEDDVGLDRRIAA